MQNDWSSFTPARLSSLPDYSPDDAPGYLIWAKIDPACLARKDLAELLAHGCPDDAELNRHLSEAKGFIWRACRSLKKRSITKICIGISWCDYVCWPGGKAWIEWYLKEFAEAGFDILPRITFTPPKLAIDADQGGTINSPPRDSLLYAAFLHEFLGLYGSLFGEYVELWNEWNLDTDWKRELDPDLRIFQEMIALGALVVHGFGKKAVLGGMAGITDENIRDLSEFAHQGLFRYVDVIGFHDLRGTWSDDIPSDTIPNQVRYIRGCARARTYRHAALAYDIDKAIERARGNMPLHVTLLEQRFRLRPEHALPEAWLTEYGFPAVCPEGRFRELYLQEIQAALFAYATDCIRSKAIPRVYWYTYQDQIAESVRKHTTGFEDVLQYYYGDTSEQGDCRLLGRLLDQGGPERVHEYALKNRMFPLVDKASLGRTRPTDYVSNKV